MSCYIFTGKWNGISDMLRPRQWNDPEGRSIYIHNVDTKKSMDATEGQTLLQAKAGQTYTQTISVVFEKNPEKFKLQKPHDQEKNTLPLVKGTVRKVTGKTTSFDIMALMLGQGHETIILLQTKDPLQKTMPEDMKAFIKTAKEKLLLSPIKAETLKEQFQELRTKTKTAAIQLRRDIEKKQPKSA